MSEQLTLDGLLGGSSEEKSKEIAKPVKKRAPKTPEKAASTIESRINALIENKKKADATEAAPKQVAAEPLAVVGTDLEEIAEEADEQEGAKKEPEVLTVSALNKSIKSLLEKSFPFLWVKGEISNFKVPGSGHMYFTLKDSGSQIRAIMFRGFAQALKFKPEDGMEVLVRCKVTAYEPRGDYQLFCEVMEPVGYGALQVAFEKLKAQLQAEGLFDQARKKLIPAFPTRIGIVTSPTGAAIRDMLNVLSRRFGGGLDITILPASVQGDKAPGEIVAQIDLANRMGLERFDVLIVGRGGGSLEDLWAFNMEEVARAVARSKIPTISAVGHEVDFTICDFVADLRAPTPSAAAELVVKNKKDLVDRIGLVHKQLVHHMQKKLQLAKAASDGFAKRLIDPKRKLQDLMLRCDEWTDRLVQSMQRFLQDNTTAVKFLREKLGSPEKRLELWKQKVEHNDQRLKTSIQSKLKAKQDEFSKWTSLLNNLSPLAILGRGYSIVKKGDQIVKESNQVKPGDLLAITLHQGELKATVK